MISQELFSKPVICCKIQAPRFTGQSRSFRLNLFPIRLPALHERREDIPLLFRHFLQEFHPQKPPEEEALRKSAGNKAHAAELLGVPVSTLKSKLKKYAEIDEDEAAGVEKI
jgi:DNA-binding NtrC family response regulator